MRRRSFVLIALAVASATAAGVFLRLAPEHFRWKKTEEIRHGEWLFTRTSWKEGLWRFEKDLGVTTRATYRGSPLPESLAMPGTMVRARFGAFIHWNGGRTLIPYEDSGSRGPEQGGGSWVTVLPESVKPEDLARGYYETSGRADGRNPWTDRQLTGTPADWVYAFKMSDGRYTGYWTDPAKLGELRF